MAKKINLAGTVKVVAVVAADGDGKIGRAEGRQPDAAQGRGRRRSPMEICSRGGRIPRESSKSISIREYGVRRLQTLYFPSTSLAMVASCMFDVPS